MPKCSKYHSLLENVEATVHYSWFPQHSRGPCDYIIYKTHTVWPLTVGDQKFEFTANNSHSVNVRKSHKLLFTSKGTFKNAAKSEWSQINSNSVPGKITI